jgi:hypothetical protein
MRPSRDDHFPISSFERAKQSRQEKEFISDRTAIVVKRLRESLSPYQGSQTKGLLIWLYVELMCIG